MPLSIDINDGYGLNGAELENLIKSLIDVGVFGINFEDQSMEGSNVKTIDEQVSRIKIIRDVSNKMNVPLFINARTNIFIAADTKHHARLMDEASERAKAYHQAGGNGFFAAGLIDLDLIKQLTDAVNMPVNIIRLPNAPSTKELAEAGVARISYGPIPQMQMVEWLKNQASAAIKWDV